MKNVIMMFAFAMVVLLNSSCSEQKPKEAKIRPVKVEEVASLNSIEKIYPGIVKPDEITNLAFKTSGLIVKTHVSDGEFVKKGQLLAEIDATDFKLDYEAKKAYFHEVTSKLDRATRLLKKNAISKQEFEATQSAYSNAKSAYENSANFLKDTKLYAPFSGFVQKKFVNNHQRVQPGQTIVCLINPSALKIDLVLPETALRFIEAEGSTHVEFEAYGGELFRTKVDSYVKASLDGTGIPVSLKIIDPKFDLEKYHVAVGFVCRVHVQVTNEKAQEGFVVPLSAVAYSNELQSKVVFVYNESTQTVERRKVIDNGTIKNRSDLIVLGDLKKGDKVVVAGTNYMSDGQKVKLLAQ